MTITGKKYGPFSLVKATAIVMCLSITSPGSAADSKLKDYVEGGEAISRLFKSDERREREMSMFIQRLDGEARIAAPDSPYTVRLDRLTSRLGVVEGISMNYLVYESDEANAFALGTGDVRIYSGLMDLLDDDELTFVIGHEIGHVVAKHSSRGSKRGALFNAVSVFSKHKVDNRQQQKLVEVGSVLGDRVFSRKQEKEADLFGLSLLQHEERPLYSGVTAMHRLAEASGTSANPVMALMATHPDPLKRAAILKKKIPKNQIPQDIKPEGISLKKFGD